MTRPLARATVTIGSNAPIEVQFNPVSLQVEITNSSSAGGSSGTTSQIATQSSAKLNLDLLFDSSATGEDVRNKTRHLRAAVRNPQGRNGGGEATSGPAGAAYVPPRVSFDWGTFTFAGVADSYRETLDFFSVDGVPLRAQVAMSLKEQPTEFAALERDNPRRTADAGAFEVPAALQGLSGAAGVARQGGDLRAARAIASANGEESLRFGSGKTLAVSAGVQLRPAVGFSPSLGPSAATLSIGGQPVNSIGGSGAPPRRTSDPALGFDARKLAIQPAARQLATDAGAGFAIDGRALPQSEAGLRSDVGLNRSLASRLRFDD